LAISRAVPSPVWRALNWRNTSDVPEGFSNNARAAATSQAIFVRFLEAGAAFEQGQLFSWKASCKPKLWASFQPLAAVGV